MTSLKSRLKKAKARLFGTVTQDIAVPFNLKCDCGRSINGVRRVSWQIATCSACDATIYVLPVNVYPATTRIRSEVLDGSVTKRLSVIVRDLALGEKEVTPDLRSSEKSMTTSRSGRAASRASTTSNGTSSDSSDVVEVSTGRSRRPDTGRKISNAAAALVAAEILVDEPAVRVPRASFGVVLRRIFTPFRLLMLSAAVLIAVTGWWLVNQRRMDDARKTWRREMDVAEKALESQDLAKLHDSLSKAVAAAHTLNRDNADSRRATSLFMQTQAVHDLSSIDMPSVLAACVSDKGKLSSEKTTSAADAITGQWFVFECSFQQSAGELTANLPLIVNSVPVTISMRSDMLKRAVAAIPQAPLLFVASVESCSTGHGEREIQIRLDGQSPVLLTTQYHAGQMGFTAINSPGLNTILELQAEFLNSNSGLSGTESQQ